MIDSAWVVLLFALGMVVMAFLIEVHPLPENLPQKLFRALFILFWPVLAVFIGLKSLGSVIYSIFKKK